MQHIWNKIERVCKSLYHYIINKSNHLLSDLLGKTLASQYRGLEFESPWFQLGDRYEYDAQDDPKKVV